MKVQSNRQKSNDNISKYWKVVEDDSSELKGSIEKFVLPKIIFKSDKLSRLNLVHTHGKAVLIWQLKQTDSNTLNVECVLFKNKSIVLNSKLIEDAMTWARTFWPHCKLSVRINPKRIASDTGKSFEVIKWAYSGLDENGKKIFEFPALPT